MIAYTQSLPSVFVKQLHTKARIRTKAGGCGVEPHTQTAFGSLLPPRGATQNIVVPPSETTTRLFISVHKNWNTCNKEYIYSNKKRSCLESSKFYGISSSDDVDRDASRPDAYWWPRQHVAQHSTPQSKGFVSARSRVALTVAVR